jgi:serine/threonine protein kinase
MTLSAGTKLGPYEILAPIGAGGMGEVYKARDARLERVVAIKVLLDRSVPSAEARQRFEREAKTIRSFPTPTSARFTTWDLRLRPNTWLWNTAALEKR